MRREVRRVGEVSEMGRWMKERNPRSTTSPPTTRCAKRMEPRSDSNEVAKRLVQRRGR
jgi:hypothetical protein